MSFDIPTIAGALFGAGFGFMLSHIQALGATDAADDPIFKIASAVTGASSIVFIVDLFR